MKGRLLWKLLGINLLIIGVVIVIVWLAVNFLAADYFTVLMEKYNISPTSSHEMFVGAIHRYLIWASLGALLLAVVLSYLMMTKILRPLVQMTRITKKISSGDYSSSVPVETRDEVGELALAFNHMSESLQQVERLRKTMIMDAAHELRTPLTNIRGYLEALIDGVVRPAPETFNLLQNETFRLISLVEDLLRLAKADAARAGLNKVEVHLVELIYQMADVFRAQFKEKGLEMNVEVSGPRQGILADRGQLSQVIQNLLHNCWQYTPAGEKVEISVEFGSKAVRVVFSNPGGEITADNLPYIFERFYRAEKSRSRDHGGAGIGLAIVKELIQAHAGRVGAELEQRQIRIWFELPLEMMKSTRI